MNVSLKNARWIVNNIAEEGNGRIELSRYAMGEVAVGKYAVTLERDRNATPTTRNCWIVAAFNSDTGAPVKLDGFTLTD